MPLRYAALTPGEEIFRGVLFLGVQIPWRWKVKLNEHFGQACLDCGFILENIETRLPEGEPICTNETIQGNIPAGCFEAL